MLIFILEKHVQAEKLNLPLEVPPEQRMTKE